MPIVDGLQRIMKGTTRALVESKLKIKEAGQVEDAVQPEVITKRSDSSGYLHLPTLEWLNGYVAGKGGAREIGVEFDNFQILNGNTRLQTVIKNLDTYLQSLEIIGVFNLDTSSHLDQASVAVTYIKKGNIVFLHFPYLSSAVKTGGASAVLTFEADAFFAPQIQPYVGITNEATPYFSVFHQANYEPSFFEIEYSEGKWKFILRSSTVYADEELVIWQQNTLPYYITPAP